MNAEEIKRSAVRILAIFTAEKGLCERMIALLTEEQTALTVMDMKKIISMSVAKQDLASRIMREDRLFQDEAGKLLPEHGDGTGRLAAVAAKVGGAEGDELVAYGRILRELKERSGTINEVNREYIRSTLGYLGDAITILTGPVGDGDEYHGPGSLNGRRRSPEMVSREV